MDTVKTILASRTVWAAIAGIVAQVLSIIFKIEIDDETKKMIADLLFDFATVLSLLGAIVYRVKAKKKIVPAAAMPSAAKMLLILGLLSGASLTACATLEGKTTDQRFFGLVSDYAGLQTLAIGYKENCEKTHLPNGCEEHVAVLQEIDGDANRIIQAAASNTDQPDYINASYTALTTVFNRFSGALTEAGAQH
jgi:hypothetical protein